MKNQKPWTITAKSNSEIEILLYEMIGQDFWTGEGTTAKSFAEDLKAAGDGIRKIHLRVNSPGGSVFDGLAIYNTLLGHGAKVTATVDGLAASIASVIIMAASEISMGDNAMMMIHNPSCMIAGDSNEMRKMAETMDKVKTSMIGAYRRHSKQSAEKIGALMDAETWMTAEETVDNGFAELVTTPEGDEADLAANFGQVFAKFRKVPQQIAARFAGSTSHTKRVDGENLTSECFISGDEEKTDTWHLPWKFSSEEKTVSHLRDALARFDQADIPASEKPPARAKLVRLAKEHGIAVSDAKSGKALARLLAAVRADAGTKCGCTCLPCSKENNCQDCTDKACDDEDCEDCAMQAKAAKAKAKARKKLHAANACTCSCLPCSKENNCQDCDDSACVDDECEACPMQAKTVKSARARIQRLEAQIESQSAANGAAETTRRGEALSHNRWLVRMGGELQESAALYTKTAPELAERVTAAQTLQVEIRARVAATEKVLTALRTERGSEVTALTKWTERVGAELQQASTLYAAAVEDVIQRSQMQGEMRVRLDAAENVLSELKEERAAELKTLAGWTERLSGDLRRSGALHASLAAQIGRRPGIAGRSIARKIEAAENVVSELKAKWAAEVTATGNWLQRVASELGQSGTLQAEAIVEEILRPDAGDKSFAQKIEAVEAHAAQLKNKRAGEWKALDRVAGELRQAAALDRSALEGMARIAPSGEASGGPIEAAEAILAQLQAGHDVQVTSLARWTERVSGELAAALKAPLEQSASLLGAVREELARRTHLAAGASGEFAAHTEQAAKLLLQLKGERAAEAAAVAQAIGELRESSALYGSALEETGRRARLAESDPEIEAAEAILRELKSEHAAQAAAGAESTARLRGKLQDARQLHASALDEITRRARLTDGAVDIAQIGAEFDAAGAMLSQAKGECGAELEVQATAIVEWSALVNGELQESSKLQTAVLEEITHRARLAESSQDLAAHLEEAVTILGQFKTERAAEVTAVAEWTGRVTKQLLDSGKLHASATEEITRRARLGGSAGQVGDHLEAAETLLGELKTAVAVDLAIDPAITANLKKADTMHGSAVEEIARRARLQAL